MILSYQDPPGKVTIVNFPDGPDMAAQQKSVSFLGFEAFDNR